MKDVLMILAFYSLLLSSCTKEGPMGPSGKDGSVDKQIRFDLQHINNFSTTDTTLATLENSPCGIHQFNIGNYTGIDSVIFVVYDIGTASGCCGAPDVNESAKIELFNLTDNQPIANSEITSDDITQGTFRSSENIVNSFPDKTIDIGIRIIFNKNMYMHTGHMYLFLYRK